MDLDRARILTRLYGTKGCDLPFISDLDTLNEFAAHMLVDGQNFRVGMMFHQTGQAPIYVGMVIIGWVDPELPDVTHSRVLVSSALSTNNLIADAWCDRIDLDRAMNLGTDIEGLSASVATVGYQYTVRELSRRYNLRVRPGKDQTRTLIKLATRYISEVGHEG